MNSKEEEWGEMWACSCCARVYLRLDMKLSVFHIAVWYLRRDAWSGWWWEVACMVILKNDQG